MNNEPERKEVAMAYSQYYNQGSIPAFAWRDT
jgi:hypothetical protein